MSLHQAETGECRKKGLFALPVDDQFGVNHLRLVRNACKDGFSHDNTEISEIAQRAWWVANKGRVRAWLYCRYPEHANGTMPESERVGYGLVRQAPDGRWWSSVAVLPMKAGHGFGGAITADLVRRTGEPTYGQARLDNPAAMRLHRAADWEEIERDDRLVTYRTMPHVYDGRLADWAAHGWVTA